MPRQSGKTADPGKPENRPGVQTSFDLLLLTGIAGTMDALSYLNAGVFTANMTGNTVILGLAAAGFDRSRLLPACLSLVAFAVGALTGAFVLLRGTDRRLSDDLKIGTALEAPFTAAFAILTWISAQTHPYWARLALLSAAACALGIQSVAVRRMKISGVVTTFITGTITTAIVAIFSKPKAEIEREGLHPNSPFILAAMFLLYILAAAAGAWLTAAGQAGWAATIPVALLLIVMFRSWTSAAGSRKESAP